MRTSIDIPDALLDQVRPRLRAQQRTLREAVIDGLRRTVLEDDGQEPFALRDAAFVGEIGFATGFTPDDLTAAVHQAAEGRLLPSPGKRRRK